MHITTAEIGFKVDTCKTTNYKRSFFIGTTIDWNNLEDDVVKCPSVETFQDSNRQTVLLICVRALHHRRITCPRTMRCIHTDTDTDTRLHVPLYRRYLFLSHCLVYLSLSLSLALFLSLSLSLSVCNLETVNVLLLSRSAQCLLYSSLKLYSPLSKCVLVMVANHYYIIKTCI
jgi:hypothetical protein